MNLAQYTLLAIAAAGTACIFTACQNPASAGDDEDPPLTAAVTYLGSSSKGGFHTLQDNRSGRAISYENVTLGSRAQFTYHVEGDTSYAITSGGQLVDAWCQLNTALFATSTFDVPVTGSPSLVTAIPATRISRDLLSRGAYAALRFRTQLGGFEAGWLRVQPNGSVDFQTFSPYRAHQLLPNEDPFQTPRTWDSGNMLVTTNNLALRLLDIQADPASGYCHIFQSTGGMLGVDLPDGSLICTRQPVSAIFDATHVGTYGGAFYRKTDTSVNLTTDREEGTGDVGKCTVTISGNGHIRVTSGTTLVDSDFAPVVGSALHGGIGSGVLVDDCNGLFFNNDTEANITRYLFVTFRGNAVNFGCYLYNAADTAADADHTKPYSYFYGSALKTANTITPIARN